MPRISTLRLPLPRYQRCGFLLVLAALWAGGGGVARAQVGITPDDVQAIAPGGCQVEGWYSHANGANAWMSLPACSEAQPVRLGAFLQPLTQVREGNWGLGAAARYTDSDWRLGPARWGLKIATFTQRLADLGRMQMEHATLTGLSTLRLPADLTLRLNLGPKHQWVTRETTTLLDAALAWSFGGRFTVAGEMKASDRTQTVQSVGTSLWLVPGRLGVKLNVGRTLGIEDSAVYGFQLHWHLLDRKPIRSAGG
ncbi:hypothetical protein M8A51_05040 [Schlegelella sp. S2-27]|uniref:Transporter n=1 Tax=Caldimonas mangrovi TaxID=2944811 RepID=A0ABT0YJJ6_9BURK|nr:hypothetical protein [Caldimonas mangrovi]MCM5678893.1 hypothetical protein [Caldimonas mangrovi]